MAKSEEEDEPDEEVDEVEEEDEVEEVVEEAEMKVMRLNSRPLGMSAEREAKMAPETREEGKRRKMEEMSQ